MKNIFLLFFLIISAAPGYSQMYLSNLNSDKNTPIYTTYAASLERSEYKIDQAYQFVWFDPEKGVNFETDQSGSLGIAFKLDSAFKYQLKQYHKEPVITASYSDLVKYFYYPFENIKVEAFFVVHSSRAVIHDIKITNESMSEKEVDVYPYLSYPKNLEDVQFENSLNGFTFYHNKPLDGWMRDQNIPLQTDIYNLFSFSEKPDASGLYKDIKSGRDSSLNLLLNDIKNKQISSSFDGDIKLMVLQKNLIIPAGKSVSFRIIRLVNEKNNYAEVYGKNKNLFTEDLSKYIKDDESVYTSIPKIKFKIPEHENLYWNAFTLIRQCMMPPEGKSSFNYYVFSREPKWGWGYGGQVFHESLVMLAYAYMDAVSAMNSQRVFIERQWENGYINYRTGPYLDEQIPTNNQLTSSAPWFNFQNWEVYNVTKDKKFLEEAFNSGKKFYKYYTSNRDSDRDGLCEWGAHAVLESVRDARVAVWDEVADPVNFDAVDCNIMLVSEAKALSEMAKELGMSDESERFLTDANNRAMLINKHMWDDATGFYYNIDKKDNDFSYNKENDLKRKEIIAFLALWAGVPDKERAGKLVKHLTNPDEFWRNFGVPTLSADDSYYNPIGYWNGPIWLPWQYLVFRGLMNYGYQDEANTLVNKVLDNVSYQLKTNHYFWEFYSADDYQAGWNKTYIWTGILARMLIDINNIKE